MGTTTRLPRRSSSRRWIFFVLLLVVAAVAGVFVLRNPSSRAATDAPATTIVQRVAHLVRRFNLARDVPNSLKSIVKHQVEHIALAQAQRRLFNRL